MQNEIIDNYLYNDYEQSYKINNSKYEFISILFDKITKINSYIEKFIKEKMENKILKDKLSGFKEEKNLHDLFSLIQKTIDTTFNENYKMINKILNCITELKKSFKSYFKKYDEFIISQKKFGNKLMELENYKFNFYESAKKAELLTYDFLKKKVFNIKIKNQNEFKEKEKLQNIAKTELDKYKNKINEINEELKLFNDNQKDIFKAEKELEIQYNSLYSDSLMVYLEYQLLINELTTEIKETIVQLNENSNKKKLKDYLKNYRQIEKINIEQYRTHIEFDNCDDAIQLSACFMAYNEMAHIIGKYKEIELLNETQKIQLNKDIIAILRLDDKITEEDIGKIEELLKTEIGQNVFISNLSTLRSNGLYEKSEKFIHFIGKMLNIILDYAEKEHNFEKAKNCIILSQTFFYYDLNKQRFYIFGLIKHNKWLKGTKFWRDFIGIMLEKEFQKLINFKKQNLNDVLLTQLLPFINNMREFGIDNCIIIKIIDEYLEKYQYLNEESKKTLFTLISSDIDEIEELRKKYKENPELEKELYKNEDEKDNKNNDDIKEDINNQEDISIEPKNEVIKQKD